MSFHSCIYVALAFLTFLTASYELPRDALGASRPVNVTTTVLDHNGVDISSSFKVMVYRQPVHNDMSSATKSNSTMNNLNKRMETTKFAQLVNACPANETFISSHCDPEAGGDFAMQKYIYTCRRTEATYSETSGNVIGSRPVYRIRDGHCNDDEMCVQSYSPNLMAACVKIWLFDDFQIDKNGIARGMLGGAVFSLDNVRMYAAVSESDASKAVELSKLEIDASNDQENVDEAAMQTFKCRNCVDLNTDAFKPNTNALKVQATLLTSGAMTGILWLGLMSG